MDKSAIKKSGLFLGLYLSLVLPSLGQAQKYFGAAGIFLYAVCLFLALFLIYRYWLNRFLLRITDRQASYFAALTILCLVVVFFIVHPKINAGIGRSGSDRDEEANIAAGELLQLRYPYYQKTYLDNSMTRFPGAILLSAPFVLLGNSAFQNFFWLYVFFILTASFINDRRLALILFWIILFSSPVVMQELLTGGDFLANTIYILFFIFFLLRCLCTAKTLTAKRVFAAVLLGIGLSSRLNFILLLPPVFSLLVQNAGWGRAFKYTGLVGFVFLALTIPFYLYDPGGFTPLYWQFSKINRYCHVLPFSGALVVSLGIIVALAGSIQRLKCDCVALFRNCAIIQFFLVLSVVILGSLAEARLNFIFSSLGISFLFFGAPAFWYSLTQETGRKA
jgi:hypothetical protein